MRRGRGVRCVCVFVSLKLHLFAHESVSMLQKVNLFNVNICFRAVDSSNWPFCWSCAQNFYQQRKCINETKNWFRRIWRIFGVQCT